MKTTWTILGLAGVALLAGCVKQSTTSSGAINTEPLTIDAAMQKRNWEPTNAHYENGDTPGCPTGFAYTPEPGRQGWTYYFSDTGTYFVNLVTLPWTVYQERDGIVSTGVQLPPTYTANPPLPPSVTAEPPATQPGK